ncbi:hypothetical protein RhiirC2_789217, partial [Rhizophagus irregularis]
QVLDKCPKRPIVQLPNTANRYKSCGEPQKKKVRRIQDITNTTNKNRKEDVAASQEGKKKERCCKNCNQVGHYAPRCPNI